MARNGRTRNPPRAGWRNCNRRQAAQGQPSRSVPAIARSVATGAALAASQWDRLGGGDMVRLAMSAGALPVLVLAGGAACDAVSRPLVAQPAKSTLNRA